MHMYGVVEQYHLKNMCHPRADASFIEQYKFRDTKYLKSQVQNDFAQATTLGASLPTQQIFLQSHPQLSQHLTSLLQREQKTA